jgi:hypothetical protein
MPPPIDPELPSDSLARIRALGVVGKEPDPNTAKESADLDKKRLEAEIHGLEQDIDERKRYASRFFLLSCAWLLSIIAILMLQGFGSIWFGRLPFKLSENVLLAVIGSTTVNVLGILYVVAKYLFPERRK